MINAERINSQLALLQEKVIASVHGGGGGGGGEWMPPQTFHT